MYREKDKRKKYLEQWERLKRWYVRIKKIQQGQHSGSDDYQLDEAYAFFLNCFHLKDWIITAVPEAKEDTENLFDKSDGRECFRVCADLANANKHVEASKTTRIDPDTNIKRQHVAIQLRKLLAYSVIGEDKDKSLSNEGLPPLTKYKWEIEAKDQYYEVYQLIDKCMEEWEKFLRNKKLI